MRDFTEDSKEEIWRKSKFAGWEVFRGFLMVFPMFQEVGILPTLVYFPF